MRKYLYWLLPFIWMGIIFFASSQPYEKQNIQPLLSNTIDLSFLKPYVEWISFTYNTSQVSVESLGVEGFVEFFVRKGAHVFVFFLLLHFFYIALHQTTNITFRWKLVIAFVLSFSYAGFDEFHQGFTENRTSYIGDVFLDGFGSLLAVMLLILIYFMRRNNRNINDRCMDN